MWWPCFWMSSNPMIYSTPIEILSEINVKRTAYISSRYHDGAIKKTHFTLWCSLCARHPWKLLPEPTLIVNWDSRIKLQRKFPPKEQIFNKGNAFENVVCKISAMFSRSWYVKSYIIHPCTVQSISTHTSCYFGMGRVPNFASPSNTC